MQETGPELHYLLHRLSNCPEDFLKPPFIPSGQNLRLPSGHINTLALVSDLVYLLSGQPLPNELLNSFKKHKKYATNYLRLLQVVVFLFHDEWFLQKSKYSSRIKNFLLPDSRSILVKLAKIHSPETFLDDPERREELVRLCLDAVSLRPQGETSQQAKDRLATLDSMERDRLMAEAKIAAKRAEELKRKMREKAAREAASKMPRE
ncbi:MAG: hypothetical protein AAF518_04845 [Spirochaetota bacterium]